MNIRIFFSSPGDVKMERETAKRIVDRLQSEIGDTAAIQPYFWEHEVMVATKDYQENIPHMDDFDIVVCILWSRLGTPLDPSRHPRPGGGGFASGTEYEFFTAMKAHEVRGTPDIFVFRNTTEPRRPSRPKEVREAVDREIDRLDNFFETYFEDDTFFTRAINIYSTLGEFEDKLTIALRSYITGRIPVSTSKISAIHRPTYDRQPYLGLASFDYEDAPVFFGRTAQVGEIITSFQAQELEAQTNTDIPPKHFVMVLGSSGSGKSSLARAGVLPMLTNPGVIEGANSWRTAIFKPADASSDPILALVNSLNTPRGLPELFADGTKPKELADLIRVQPQGGGLMLRQALTQAGSLALSKKKKELEDKLDLLVAENREEDAKVLRGKIDTLETPAVRIALLADQLEELFTSDLSPETLNTFVGILVALANSGRVFLIATLRSDFYPRCLEHPELIALMQGNGTYALPAPSATDIGQMIRQPAAIAGLSFEEKTSSGEKLDELLRDAALKDPTALPLLSYTLEQLYEQRTPEGLLTLDAYRQLGGLEGAIGSRAETVFSKLPGEAQGAFDGLCKQLITLQEGGEPTRRRAFYSTLTRTPESKTLVDALVTARLLTADQSPDGERIISVAHEALLRHWPRLVSWVEENRLFLNTRTRVASRMADWLEKNKIDEYLIPRGPNLSAAESILAGHLASLDPLEIEFIGRSAERIRREDQRHLRNARMITAGAVVLCLIAVAGGIFAMAAKREAQRDRNKAQIQEKAAIKQKGIAVESAERATKSEARTSYILGVQQLDEGATRDGMLALAKTLAIEPGHEGAMERLYSEHLYGLPKAIPIRSVAFDRGDSLSRQRISGAVKGSKKLVAYLGNEKSTEVFDLVTRKVIPGPWEKETFPFASVISGDSKTVWNIREDLSMQLWNVETKKASKTLKADPKYTQLATTSDGRYFFQGLRDGSITVYSTEDGNEVTSWKQDGNANHINEDPTGTRMICVSEKAVSIYDIKAKTHTEPIPVQTGSANFLTTVALTEPVFATIQIDAANPWPNKKQVIIRSTETGQIIPLDKPIETDDWISAISLTSTGDRVFIARENGAVVSYKIPEGTADFAIQLPNFASQMTVSPDDRLLLTATPDGTVRIHELESSLLAFDPINHDGALEDLGISWDGRYVIAATKNHARIWDLATGPALNLPASIPSRPWSYGIDLGKNQFVVSCAKGYAKFDLKEMSPLAEFIPIGKGATGTLLSKDASTFAEYRQGDDIAFVKSEDGKFSNSPVWHAGPEEGFWNISSNGSLFTWIEKDQVIFVDTSTAKPIGEITKLPAPSNGVVDLSATNRLFASICLPENHIDLGSMIVTVDLKTRKIREFNPQKISFERVLFSPDERWLVASGRRYGQANENYCFVWDLESPDSEPVAIPAGGAIVEVIFSRDSQFMAFLAQNHTVQVCDPETGKTLAPPIAINDAIPTTAVFSPDGSRIATLATGEGKTVLRIWDWLEQVPVSHAIEVPNKASFLAYNEDGSMISTIWQHPLDSTGEQHMLGQWETKPNEIGKRVIIPLTESATARRSNPVGAPQPCDPFDSWERIREIDKDSWFLKAPLARTISPASEATTIDWLEFPYMPFNTMTRSMPAVGLIHARIATWLRNNIEKREAELLDLDQESEKVTTAKAGIESTREKMRRHQDIAERNAENDPDTQYVLGQMAYKQDDEAKAITYLESALSLRPGHEESLWLLEKIHEDAGRFKEALLVLEELRELTPEDKDLLFHTGTALWATGAKEDARKNFSRAYEKEGLQEPEKAIILTCIGRPSEAMPIFQKLADEQKNSSKDKTYNAASLVFLITGHSNNGNIDEAIENYRQLITAIPNAAVPENIRGAHLHPLLTETLLEVLKPTLEKYPDLTPEPSE